MSKFLTIVTLFLAYSNAWADCNDYSASGIDKSGRATMLVTQYSGPRGCAEDTYVALLNSGARSSTTKDPSKVLVDAETGETVGKEMYETTEVKTQFGSCKRSVTTKLLSHREKQKSIFYSCEMKMLMQ